jgi:hypothetical protein
MCNIDKPAGITITQNGLFIIAAGQSNKVMIVTLKGISFHRLKSISVNLFLFQVENMKQSYLQDLVCLGLKMVIHLHANSTLHGVLQLIQIPTHAIF